MKFKNDLDMWKETKEFGKHLQNISEFMMIKWIRKCIHYEFDSQSAEDYCHNPKVVVEPLLTLSLNNNAREICLECEFRELELNWEDYICHDCGVKVGEIHKTGCDNEICITCGNQLISCGHYGSDIYYHSDRIPYIPRINLCSLCGTVFPEMFSVPDEEWIKYVVPWLQNTMICRGCYNSVKEILPEGWRNVIVSLS